MLALRWCDVDLAAGILRVRQTVYEGQFDTPKTKRSRRVVPLSLIAVQILRLQKQGSGVSLIRPLGHGNCALSAEPAQPAVPADSRKAWAEGFQLALAAACHGELARCRGCSPWHSADSARAHFIGGNARALHPCGLIGVA
jgi:integrase